MKLNIVARVFLAIFLVAGLLCIGFYGLIFAVFSAGQRFYAPLVMIVTGVLIILVLLGTSKVLKFKILAIITVSFLAICAGSYNLYGI